MARRSQFRQGKWGNKSSINTIITDYKRFVGVVEAEAMDIMQDAADLTLEYILPYVPIETGALKESGTARAVKTSKGVAAVVSFGGPDNPVSPTKNAPEGVVDYAQMVNYGGADKEFQFGEDMFLEKGTMESKDAVDALIKRRLKAVKP